MSDQTNPPSGETPDESMRRLEGNDAPPPPPSQGWGAEPTGAGSPYGDANDSTPPPPPPPVYGSYNAGPPNNGGYGGNGGDGFNNGQFGNNGGMPPADHPKTVTILVLGILSILCCQLLGPVVWYMGHQARAESEANPALNSNNTTLTIGWILGIIGTVLLVLSFLFYATGITGSLLAA